VIVNANALHIPLADKCVHTIVTEHDEQSVFMQYVKLDEDIKLAESIWRVLVRKANE
jgi:hypothetical protein